MARRKKDLGNFLGKKKSWKKVLRYLERYLNKYGNWEYTYEFDAGSIKIVIKTTTGDKLVKADKSHLNGEQGVENPMLKHKVRRLHRLKCKAKLEKK